MERKYQSDRKSRFNWRLTLVLDMHGQGWGIPARHLFPPEADLRRQPLN